MTDRAITGVLALCPGRAAAATLEQVLAQPDLANDLIVIVGDSSRQRDKRATYRAIFSTLGRVRRPVLWVPEYTESAFEREVRRAYASAQPRPTSRSARGLLMMRGARPSQAKSTRTKYDLRHCGLGLVASPRNADILLISGAVTTRMHDALLTAYLAMPEPRRVAALGNSASTSSHRPRPASG
jgi:hypothetical protein